MILFCILKKGSIIDFLKQLQCLASKTDCLKNIYLEIVTQGFSKKIGVPTCTRVFYLIKLPCNCIKKGISAQVLSCEFSKIFRNNYFVKKLQIAASVYCQGNVDMARSLFEIDLLLIHLI